MYALWTVQAGEIPDNCFVVVVNTRYLLKSSLTFHIKVINALFLLFKLFY